MAEWMDSELIYERRGALYLTFTLIWTSWFSTDSTHPLYGDVLLWFFILLLLYVILLYEYWWQDGVFVILLYYIDS